MDTPLQIAIKNSFEKLHILLVTKYVDVNQDTNI